MKKTALVTGAAGGIGFAVVNILLKNGFAVAGMGPRSAPPYTPEGDFLFFRGDVRRQEDRLAFIEAAKQAFGGVHVLVNAAGIAPKVRRDLLEMTPESYDEVMDTNLKGALFLTVAAAKEMIKNTCEPKGAVVNISSLSAYTSSVSRGEYCISKAGVSMLTALFADRLAEYGIPVNEVRPGIIKTKMTEKAAEKYDRLIRNGLLPEKRWGTPEDVAAAVLPLCTGALPYVTGQSIDVDGGFHIRRL